MNWTGKYFTLEEMTASPTARRLGIDNTPTPDAVIALHNLVKEVLDPLREAWGAPIVVTSGYRCPKLNSCVGGVRMSQHCLGQAADIRTLSDRPSDNRKLRDLLIEIALPFDQLIDEFGCDWLHVSYREGRNRKERITAYRKNKKTLYEPGFKK